MASKGSSAHRGYGYHHRKLRAELQPHIDAGEAICWRCRQPIHPGTPWDLGHDDDDRNIYRGPEHQGCNRGSAATRGNRARTRTHHSRDWLR